MSTSVIEPGTRLAGRYRLESRVSDAGGSTLWKAIDEILARAVAVRTFAPEFPHINAVVTAARAASRLTDPRLTQVFDADDSDELAYVVSEWVSGETLHDMVSSRGPLEPGRAATLLCEAAEAISAAHAAGLAHLKLTSHDLLWTTGGTVKLLGLGVEAALDGVASDAPALVDAQGLGRMLYAALTAHAPTAGEGGLPTAVTADGRLPAPRTLQARVPQALDAIVCRTLGIEPAPGQEPLTTPAALAKALSGVPRTPLPLFAGLGTNPTPPIPRPASPRSGPPPRQPAGPPAQPAADPARRRPPPPRPAPRAGTPQRPVGRHGGPGSGEHGTATRTTPVAHGGAGHGTPPGHRATPARPAVNRPLIAVAAAVATIVVGIGAWKITTMGDGGQGTTTTTSPSATSAPPAPTKLQIARASGFDPTQPNHPDPTAQSTGQEAVDSSPSSAWRTQTYASADFGKLKGGLGVMLDMGRPVKIDNVRATLPGAGGGSLQLRVGSAPELSSLKIVDRSSSSGSVTLKPTQPTEGQYVLLWFTKLPSGLKAQISDVDVFGWTG
ncbi:protein kinase family protein [Actinomadura alba]|uniref:non-specific serine/threonine protein kinase n=1 Tax=Actinomadura alba TaxID=406431 RepID=A0ABR7LMW1_9ACTN|nr:protein kinase family protein [Actinomadura alba]MBC6466172.1 AMP-binding protein [Actinomadura alba]